MKTRAAVARAGSGRFSIEEVEVVSLGPRDIFVRTGAAAYCVTDNLISSGLMGRHGHTVFGHSAVGIVEEVGSSVTRVKVGDRVACGGTPECGVCPNCARGRPDQCRELFQFQLPLGRAAGDGAEVFACPVGGYAEVMRIPEIWAFPIDSTLPDELLCMLGCGVTSAVGAVLNVAEVCPGATVAILGCGHLGLWMIQGARLAGAERVIAVEPLAARRELGGRLGATDLVDPAAGDPVEQVNELTGGSGVDFAFEAAGAVEAMAQALAMTLNTGVTVTSSLDLQHGLGAEATFNGLEMVGGKDIRANQNGRCSYRRDLPRFIKMMEEGRLQAEPILSGRHPLEEINEIAARAGAREALTAAIVPALKV